MIHNNYYLARAVFFQRHHLAKFMRYSLNQCCLFSTVNGPQLEEDSTNVNRLLKNISPPFNTKHYALNLIKLLPDSEFYIFEEEIRSPITKMRNNPKLFMLSLSQSQFISTLTTILNCLNNDDPKTPKVYYLKSNFAAKTFDCYLHSEKISIRNKMDYCFDTDENYNKKLWPLPVDANLKHYYTKQTEVGQEMLCQALVQLSAFRKVIYSSVKKSLIEK